MNDPHVAGVAQRPQPIGTLAVADSEQDGFVLETQGGLLMGEQSKDSHIAVLLSYLPFA